MSEPATSNPVSLTSADIFRDLSLELLRQGKSIRFHAPGRSMYPSIKENEVITVEPISPSAVQTGDILLYQSGQHLVAHRVVRIDLGGDGARLFILRGDTWGTYDQPVKAKQIFGKVVGVERKGQPINPYSRKAQIRLIIHTIASWIKSRVTRS